MAGKRILTNRYNLPQTLVDAVKYDTHKLTGTISVTTLIDGPRIRILKKMYDYESDVIDNIYALMGTALHHILERANIESIRQRSFILVAETLIEKAKLYKDSPSDANKLNAAANWLFSLIPIFFPETKVRYIFERTMQLDMGDNFIISGTFDLFDRETGTLYDYKFCSVYMYMDGSARKKWIEQTNIYAYMLHRDGFNVTRIVIVAFFRDWNEHGLLNKKDYPTTQIKEIPLYLYPFDETKKMIDYYTNLHRRAEAGDIPDCSGEIRWATSDTFAVMPTTAAGGLGKRALKIFDTKPAAVQWIQEHGHTQVNEPVIQERTGESRRCKKYCPVNKFCPQYKIELEKEKLLNAGKV